MMRASDVTQMLAYTSCVCASALILSFLFRVSDSKRRKTKKHEYQSAALIFLFIRFCFLLDIHVRSDHWHSGDEAEERARERCAMSKNTQFDTHLPFESNLLHDPKRVLSSKCVRAVWMLVNEWVCRLLHNFSRVKNIFQHFFFML